jgi:uncharacterized protein YuzE
MQIRLDPDVNALYIEFREGKVAKTIELADMVYLDVDHQGDALGLEFVNADDFIPFLREHAGAADVPAELRELIHAPAPR